MIKINWKVVGWAPLPVVIAAAWLTHREGSGFSHLLRSLLLIYGYAAAAWDFRKHRVPNQLVLAMAGSWALVMAPQLILRWDTARAYLLSGLIGAVMGGLIFLIVYLISRHGLGGGDVKFMTAAGLYLGFSGVMPTMLMGSVLAAIVGIVLIAMKKIDRKGQIALVPFLYIGIVLTMLFQ